MVYLCAIRDDMLMQLAKMNPTLPKYRVSSVAAARNTAENTNIDPLYLGKEQELQNLNIIFLLVYLSTCSWLMAANMKHSVMPFTARKSTYTQYQRSNIGPEQSEREGDKEEK